MTIQADVVIVGAGPCGLFQVFELGLLGITAHVVDALPKIGGQCSTLYPQKPIYDIPALPVCGAQELIDRLAEQIKPFAAEFHLGQTVTEVTKLGDGRFALKTSTATEFHTKAIVIAGGLGPLQPRPLRLAGIEHFEDKNLHYKVVDTQRFNNKNLVILGGGDSALDWTLELHRQARSIALIHRREQFRAQPASVARMKQISQSFGERMRYIIGKVKGFEANAERITALQVEPLEGEALRVPLDELLVFYGLTPQLGPIADWGLEIEKRQIRVDTEKFQTNIPGIFAIGDVNTYPGKKKLILSGFHEAALTAFAIQKHLYPEKKQFVQYTTTSPIMHERLGVSGKIED